MILFELAENKSFIFLSELILIVFINLYMTIVFPLEPHSFSAIVRKTSSVFLLLYITEQNKNNKEAFISH